MLNFARLNFKLFSLDEYSLGAFSSSVCDFKYLVSLARGIFKVTGGHVSAGNKCHLYFAPISIYRA